MKFSITLYRVLFVLVGLMFTSASLRAEEHGTFKVGELTFARPDKWEWVEPSGMRAAQLKVPSGDAKAAGEVVFFQFPSSAGGTQANVDRWLRQFDPRTSDSKSETTVGKTKITYVQAEGTFKSGMPGGPTTPMTDYALMGAIIETDDGNIFVKMTGPKDLVKASTAEFKKMVEAAPKKG